MVTKFTHDQAQTQSVNVTQQLDGGETHLEPKQQLSWVCGLTGIRFFDFRIMYEHDSQDWHSLHLLQTHSQVLVYLTQVCRAFLMHSILSGAAEHVLSGASRCEHGWTSILKKSLFCGYRNTAASVKQATINTAVYTCFLVTCDT